MGNYCSSCHMGESLAVKLCEDCAQDHRNNWPHGQRESFLGLGSEPIPYVVLQGHVHCLKVLLEARVMKDKDKNWKRICNLALIYAVCYGHVKCMELLIDVRVDVHIVLNAPLLMLLAARHGSANCVELLIRKGADVNAVDSDNNTNNTPLIFAAGQNINCAKLLLEANAKINMFNKNMRNALCNHIERRISANKPPDRTMVLLLYAAGETLDGITLLEDDHTSCLLDYLEKPEISLRHLSREAIRKHLRDINCCENLFDRVPRLGLPKTLTLYMLFNMSLNGAEQ